MRVLSGIPLLMIVGHLMISTVLSKDTCEDTKIIVSECDAARKYQWLIEVPKTDTSCKEESVSDPRAVPCNSVCPSGEAVDKNSLNCEPCPAGTFSLGGGQQITFDDSVGLKLRSGLSVRATSLVSSKEDQCNKDKLWRVKGGILQGEVQMNCAIELVLRFKLQIAGSVTISYSLPTSFVFGSITSRCSFDVKDEDSKDPDSESELRRSVETTLPPTGYGTWKDKKVDINEPGEYVLSLYTIGLKPFHFPFSIRSIIVEGNSFLQECIPCPPGTFASKSGSTNCTSCSADSIAPKPGSEECKSCDSKTEYSDDSNTNCKKRPDCELKDYQKVLIGCDKSNKATFKYIPIEPKICINDVDLPSVEQISCGTCNPGMYKDSTTDKCIFCPKNTYSNGTLPTCLSCSNDLSLITGIYYKIWNELPTYLTRNYISFEETSLLTHSSNSRSWIPSIHYISSQAMPDSLSVLSLTIDQGFRRTEVTKITRQYGTLNFKFSVQCQSICVLTLVSQDTYDDDFDEWDVIHKWHLNQTLTHQIITEYTYPIIHPNPVMFSWLFATDSDEQGGDEIRIYEIRVTNTVSGGSDRCVRCLTMDNQETECKACSPGSILSNNTCIPCPPSTVASRHRSTDPVPTICKPCINNTISTDGVSCTVPCQLNFQGEIEYNLTRLAIFEFHGSKLFTQKGSGYFHVFNASICGPASVTCAKTPSSSDLKHPTEELKIDSKLCRMGVVPNKNGTLDSVAYIDDFGEQLVNVSLSISKLFPPLRSDYNLTDLTFVYRASQSSSQSSCAERVTFLSLRCDHNIDDTEQRNASIQYTLQTPTSCAAGTCDGCTFHFLVRTPHACPPCDENSNGFRTFQGPCKFGRQEVRKVPYPYCSQNLREKVEIRRCSIFSIEIQIIVALFVIIAVILSAVVAFCWRKNRRLEYRYMQLVENANPDDDAPVDNVCAQISDEEDSGDEVQFKKQSRTNQLFSAVRNVIRKNPTNGRSDTFDRDSFLLTGSAPNDA